MFHDAGYYCCAVSQHSKCRPCLFESWLQFPSSQIVMVTEMYVGLVLVDSVAGLGGGGESLVAGRPHTAGSGRGPRRGCRRGEAQPSTRTEAVTGRAKDASLVSRFVFAFGSHCAAAARRLREGCAMRGAWRGVASRRLPSAMLIGFHRM